MKSRGSTGRSARGAARKAAFLAVAGQPTDSATAAVHDYDPLRDQGRLKYRAATQCRICGNPNLVKVLDLGQQCLTGVFPSLKSPYVGSGPVELVKCMGDDPREFCGLLQMHHSFAAADMYGDNYGYRSGLNRSMVEHLHRKADYLQNLAPVAAKDIVLDIGSNDGTSLARYPIGGPTLLGIDPSARKFAKYYRPDIELIVDFFSADLFRRRFGDRKAKIVTSIAMFYDLEKPQAFVDDVAAILADDGVWHLEQSYLPSMLQTNSYDTACHEHIEYYTLRQLDWMVQRAGLQIIDVQFNSTNGGSFAVTVGKQGGSAREPSASVRQAFANEAALGLDTLKPYEEFHERLLKNRMDLLAFLTQARQENKTVIGYGASTKGNVLLQFCDITPELIPCIAEINEDKFGCVTPGTWIPIVPEQQARDMNPDYFLVLPWHFRETIIKRETEFRQRGGKLVFPLPKLEVVS
jgi:SAM-dependent methyltransferase